ncbi:MAG: porin [candidate division Zixibacteria bacterium]|nr:porin [candidate division Zixibacteria bacterium]MDD5425537.1 porin [candidate division Zixibacteria bacterium]
MRYLRLYIVLVILFSIFSIPEIAFSAVGPFKLYSADSSSYIRFQLVSQLRSDLNCLEEKSDPDRSYAFSTRFRRIRLSLSGSLLKKELTYLLHLSTAPGSLELMDLYINYQVTDNIQLRYGQFKIPFTRYRIQSYQRLTFADWALVTRYFGAERQPGLALHNGYEKPPRWGYVFGIFNGANARSSHGIGIAQIFGEKTPNPSNLADPAPLEKYHPEIVCHGSYNHNGINVQSDTDEERKGLQYLGAFSLAFDFEPSRHREFSLRLAGEFLVKYRGVSFSSVGYAGYFKHSNNRRTEPAMTGGLFQTAYRINHLYEISLRYALVDIRKILRDDAAAYVASGADNDRLQREEELTAGFNIYFSEHAVKWQNDVGCLRYSYGGYNLTDFIIRSQLQLSF